MNGKTVKTNRKTDNGSRVNSRYFCSTNNEDMKALTITLALIGILVFKGPASFWRVLFITTLIASVVGLKILS